MTRKDSCHLKPTPTADPAGPATCCDVAAFGIVRAPADAFPAFRQQPGRSLPANFLKHADEQTVAGIAAVFQAIDRGGLTGTHFTHWGVLAAPRFLGRALLAVTFERFAVEGAWGISPHVIPHRSLHAVAGVSSPD